MGGISLDKKTLATPAACAVSTQGITTSVVHTNLNRNRYEVINDATLVNVQDSHVVDTQHIGGMSSIS